MSQLRKIVTLHELPEPERAEVRGIRLSSRYDSCVKYAGRADMPYPYGRFYDLLILEGKRKGEVVEAHQHKVVFDEPNETMQAIIAHRYYQKGAA